MTKEVGFIGLGMMGNPMSKNLIKAGFALTVWNRTKSKMEEIVALGAKPAASAKEVAHQSEVTITMLIGSSDSEEVILGKNGVLEGMKPGAVIIDMSTISPAVSRRIASKVEKKGCKMLDAPVGGTVGVAANAALTIQVGGDKEVFETHRDMLAAMGKNIFYIGGNGMGCYIKLVANAIMGTNMAVLAEAMCLGAKAGISTDLMLEVLKNSAASSRTLEIRGPNIVKGEYKAQFMLKLLFKDLGLALETAGMDSIPLPIVGLARQIYAQALVDGKGDEDFSAVAATAEKLSGVKFKR
jgi:3-hydroxyisobutyrate dehydrogenase-like beta-hydroxyacid dehydrogenase